MPSLELNIGQLNSDIQAIKNAILNSGGNIDSATPISEYAQKISELGNTSVDNVNDIVTEIGVGAIKIDRVSNMSHPVTIEDSSGEVIDVYGKNILELTPCSSPYRGMTFTFNDDGTVTVDGTSTNSIYISISNFIKVAESQKYYLYGGTSDAKIYYEFRKDGNSSGINSITCSSNSNPSSTLVTSKFNEIRALISINSGVTLSQVVLKPMISLFNYVEFEKCNHRVCSSGDSILSEPYYMSIVSRTNSDITVSYRKSAAMMTEYDRFWDDITQRGERVGYATGFARWGSEYIRPNRKIIFSAQNDGSSTFNACKNLRKVEAQYFDFSQKVRGTANSSGMYYTFYSCSALEEIEDIGLPPDYSYTTTFGNCSSLHTIAAIYVDENTKFESTAFSNCSSLININIIGTIGQTGLSVRWSTKLSKESITSIINALSTTTSGLSVTLSKTAVNSAFETSEGAADGSTSTEWTTLIAPKSNWTISLS